MKIDEYTRTLEAALNGALNRINGLEYQIQELTSTLRVEEGTNCDLRKQISYAKTILADEIRTTDDRIEKSYRVLDGTSYFDLMDEEKDSYVNMAYKREEKFLRIAKKELVDELCHMREAADRIDNLESLLKNRPTTDNLISDYVEWSNEVEKVLKNE